MFSCFLCSNGALKNTHVCHLQPVPRHFSQQQHILNSWPEPTPNRNGHLRALTASTWQAALLSQSPLCSAHSEAGGRENAFAKRVVITFPVIHVKAPLLGMLFYYDFSAPAPSYPLRAGLHSCDPELFIKHKQPIQQARPLEDAWLPPSPAASASCPRGAGQEPVRTLSCGALCIQAMIIFYSTLRP